MRLSLRERKINRENARINFAMPKYFVVNDNGTSCVYNLFIHLVIIRKQPPFLEERKNLSINSVSSLTLKVLCDTVQRHVHDMLRPLFVFPVHFENDGIQFAERVYSMTLTSTKLKWLTVVFFSLRLFSHEMIKYANK